MYRVHPGTSGQVPQLLTWAWPTSISATISRRTDQTNLRQNEKPQGGRRKSRRCLGVLFFLGTPISRLAGLSDANQEIGVPGHAIKTSASRRTAVHAGPARFESH